MVFILKLSNYAATNLLQRNNVIKDKLITENKLVHLLRDEYTFF